MNNYLKINKKILCVSIALAGCPVISFASAYHYIQFKNNTNYPANITRTDWHCMYDAGPDTVRLLPGEISEIYNVKDKNPGSGECKKGAKYIDYRFTNQESPIGKATNFRWVHRIGSVDDNTPIPGWWVSRIEPLKPTDSDYPLSIIKALCGDGYSAKLDPDGAVCYEQSYKQKEYDKTLVIFGKETAPEMVVNNFRYIYLDYLNALQKYGSSSWYKWGTHAVFYSYSAGELKSWDDVTKYYTNVVGKDRIPDTFGDNTNIINQQDFPIDVTGDLKANSETKIGNDNIVNDNTYSSSYPNTSGVNQTFTTPSYSVSYTEGTSTTTTKSIGETTGISVTIKYQPKVSPTGVDFGFTQSITYTETNSWTDHNSKTETFTSSPQNILVPSGCNAMVATTFSHANVEGTLLINKVIPAPYIFMNFGGHKYSMYLPAVLKAINDFYPDKYKKLSIQRDGDNREGVLFQGEAAFRAAGGGKFYMSTALSDITPGSCVTMQDSKYLPVKSATAVGTINTNSKGIRSRSYISIPEKTLLAAPSKTVRTGVLPW